MLTKFDAMDQAYEKAVYATKRPEQTVDLHEWIYSNYTKEQITRMYQYCKWLKLIESPWNTINTGYKLGLYETINHLVSYGEDGSETYREQVLLKPFGQVFFRHFFRICSKHRVEDYCLIEE